MGLYPAVTRPIRQNNRQCWTCMDIDFRCVEEEKNDSTFQILCSRTSGFHFSSHSLFLFFTLFFPNISLIERRRVFCLFLFGFRLTAVRTSGVAVFYLVLIVDVLFFFVGSKEKKHTHSLFITMLRI